MRRPAPNARRCIALVARQRRPADALRASPTGSKTAGCRGGELVCTVQEGGGDGSVPDPAKDVAEDVRDGESMLRRTPFALENWSVR